VDRENQVDRLLPSVVASAAVAVVPFTIIKFLNSARFLWASNESRFHHFCFSSSVKEKRKFSRFHLPFLSLGAHSTKKWSFHYVSLEEKKVGSIICFITPEHYASS
jgi:hypothetical protein